MLLLVLMQLADRVRLAPIDAGSWAAAAGQNRKHKTEHNDKLRNVHSRLLYDGWHAARGKLHSWS